MSRIEWTAAAEFGTLCDLIASDHLVCLTGAGISRGMRRKYLRPGASTTLPGWLQLLHELLANFESGMDPAEARSARRLLDPGPESSGQPAKIGSQELILAATLIRKKNEAEFDRRFREAITEEPGQFGDTHRALLELLPRGIMTFNYDGGHEAACEEVDRRYVSLDPTDPALEQRFGQLLQTRMKEFFLLKAHGSVGSGAGLVLTVEEYRDLLAKNPSFRAFVQNLFTNFNFLMVGYGLDDPDFDLFLRSMGEQFAGPLQEHIVLRTIGQKNRREEVEQRLYGIRTLHLNDFGEIPEALRQAARTAGPRLRETLDRCLATAHDERRRGHRELMELGPAGKALAGRVFLERLGDPDSFIVSEAAYSLGLLDPEGYKGRLFELIEERPQSDVLGRALTVLRSALEPGDLPRLRDWLQRFQETPPTGERPERIEKYLEYLVAYVDHKHQSDPPSTGSF